MSRKPDAAQLAATAFRAREDIVRVSTHGGCFIGASLLCVDLLVYLYANVLRVDPRVADAPDRDYFFLSKGHDVPALYGTLAESGIFDKKRLKNHLKTDDVIYWHPNRAVPGVEFHSGSLGHLELAGNFTFRDVLLGFWRGEDRTPTRSISAPGMDL